MKSEHLASIPALREFAVEVLNITGLSMAQMLELREIYFRHLKYAKKRCEDERNAMYGTEMANDNARKEI
jgi:hypothetical protein